MRPLSPPSHGYRGISRSAHVATSVDGSTDPLLGVTEEVVVDRYAQLDDAAQRAKQRKRTTDATTHAVRGATVAAITHQYSSMEQHDQIQFMPDGDRDELHRNGTPRAASSVDNQWGNMLA